MNNLSVNSPSFSGTYRLNLNQLNQNGYPSLERDYMLGVWMQRAENGDKILQKTENFFASEHNRDEKAPCMVNYIISDADDAEFENCMNKCGQKFTKIG